MLSLNQDRYIELPRNRLGRRRHRAAQHTVERARKRGRSARLPTRGLVVDAAFARSAPKRWAKDWIDQDRLCRRRPARRARRARPDYEDLLAAVAPIADVEAGDEDLPGYLHWRNDGTIEGGHAQPPQSDGQRAEFLGDGGGFEDPVYFHCAPMFHLANAGAMYTQICSRRLRTPCCACSHRKASLSRSRASV